MRSFAVRAGVLASIACACFAPAASAEQYQLLGSDGTECTFTVAHATPAEPGGTYTVSWRAGIRCNKNAGQIIVSTSLYRPPDQRWYTGYPHAYCVDGRIECWANYDWDVGDSVSGLAAGTYTQYATATVSLRDPSAVWLVVPATKHTDTRDVFLATTCLPGKQRVSCSIQETFTTQ